MNFTLQETVGLSTNWFVYISTPSLFSMYLIIYYLVLPGCSMRSHSLDKWDMQLWSVCPTGSEMEIQIGVVLRWHRCGMM